jgi:uncharacterized membrane protein YebE (DUF533 family)
MFDARRALDDFRRQAGDLARDFRLDERVGDAKSAAAKVRERLETDPQARTVAAGAGGLLLIGLLGSKGGRNLVGNIAKTGAVAALGALAYKAWSERQGRAGGEPAEAELKTAGFLIDADKDQEFALALVHAMLAAAYADGELDKGERIAVDAALIKAGASEEDRHTLLDRMPEAERFDLIAKGARSPNHAAELYAAAAATASGEGEEALFLNRLAERLDLAQDHAAAIRKAVGVD